MHGKTVLLPCWDRFSGTLMAANFRREGIDAHVLEENELLIARGLRHNAGQCIPLNIMVEESIAYMERHHIRPENALVWIHSSQLGCNIGAFPQTIQMLLEAHGGGYEKATVYVGQMTGNDISVRAVVNQYLAFICTGYMRLAGCRIRPYEVSPGETDRVLEESLSLFEEAFEKGGEIFPVVRRVADRLLSIPRKPGGRPKVAVFGDLYSRDNDVLSQDLVRVIEANGGEVITTPYTEYTKIIADAYLAKWVHEGKYKQAASSKVLLEGVKVLERKFVKEFERVTGPKPRPASGKRRSMKQLLSQYNVTTQHTGESLENILKIHHLIEAHPDIALFVQMSPAFCCPSLVTEAMAADIRKVTGIPVVTVTYDGTRSSKNDAVIPYLHFLGEKNKK
jgi:predicted nucleotide-binding protein (sugar kinase/HSP70/actin superfamily)